VNIKPTGKFLLPPKLIGSVTADPKAYSAIITWQTADADSSVVHKASSYIEYGVDKEHLGTENGGITSAERSLVDTHTVKITGLLPDQTIYYYRAIWVDEDGNTGSSEIQSFATLSRPTASNINFANITLNSATITYETSVNTTTEIVYGTNKDSLNSTYSVPAAGLSTNHTVILTDLNNTTKYYFKIKGEDADKNDIDIGSINDFSTLTMPVIDGNVQVDQNNDAPTTTYRFSWKTNVETTTVVYYQSTTTSKLSKSLPEYSLNHAIEISNLADMSTYSFEITGVDKNGITIGNAYKKDIATPKDSRPPKVSNLTVEVKSSGFGQTQKAQVVVSWETDELSTSQVEYAQGISGTEYNNKSKEDAALSNSHVVILSDLEPSKIYHLRAVSKDGSDNVGHSEDTTTITGKMQSSVMDIIVNSLEKSLGLVFSVFK
jgi:hypothetical protein